MERRGARGVVGDPGEQPIINRLSLSPERPGGAHDAHARMVATTTTTHYVSDERHSIRHRREMCTCLLLPFFLFSLSHVLCVLTCSDFFLLVLGSTSADRLHPAAVWRGNRGPPDAGPIWEGKRPSIFSHSHLPFPLLQRKERLKSRMESKGRKNPSYSVQ